MSKKKCVQCKKTKSVSAFYPNRAKCKKCHSANGQKWSHANLPRRCVTRNDWRRQHPRETMLSRTKVRANQNGLEFNLELSDLVLPKFCPILGIKIVQADGYGKDSSPALDRIDNSMGYVKGNVHIISHRANRLKSDASIAELEKLVAYLKCLDSKRNT